MILSYFIHIRVLIKFKIAKVFKGQSGANCNE